MARFLSLPRSQEIINIDLISRLSPSASAPAKARFSVAVEFAGTERRIDYGEVDGQLILAEMGAFVGMSAEQMADRLRTSPAAEGPPFELVDRSK